jgi:DNA-binding NtrC family response regulator
MKKTILIAGDSAVRYLLKDALQDDYHILGASNLQDVIELLTIPLDLALIEFMQQDTQGCDILNLITKQRPNIPVIMIGHYDEIPVIKALGVMHYIRKPFPLTNLKKMVSDVLRSNKKN